MSLVDRLTERGIGTLPELIGIEGLEAEKGRLASCLELRDELMAPNGYLHAATIVALADTSCGYGTFVSLPEGAQGFTTIELKSNFLGTKRAGVIGCEVGPRRSHDAGLGHHRHRRRRRQAPRPLSLHTADPLPAGEAMIFLLFSASQTGLRDERDAVEDDPEPHQRPYSYGLAQ